MASPPLGAPPQMGTRISVGRPDANPSAITASSVARRLRYSRRVISPRLSFSSGTCVGSIRASPFAHPRRARPPAVRTSHVLRPGRSGIALEAAFEPFVELVRAGAQVANRVLRRLPAEDRRLDLS